MSQEPPSWQLAVLHQSFLHLSSVHMHTYKQYVHPLRRSQMVCVTTNSDWLPPCVQVSSSPTVMWGWGPSLAQRSSTSYASLVSAGSLLDRCVRERGVTYCCGSIVLFIYRLQSITYVAFEGKRSHLLQFS